MASSFVPRFYRGRLSPFGEGYAVVFRDAHKVFAQFFALNR